jgi:uncharacterized membrane protein HdeD (DUF308 family)
VPLNLFLLGAIAALCFVAAALFARSWMDTRDQLFGWFGLAFAIEGVNRTALAMADRPAEGDPFFYLVRLGAFVIILYAIWNKNRGPAV